MFAKWCSMQYDTSIMNTLSTAKMVFLSKTNSEIINDHSEYRTLAVQPLFIRILENIVWNKIDHDTIAASQYANQFGFTRKKKTSDHLVRIWNLINDVQ